MILCPPSPAALCEPQETPRCQLMGRAQGPGPPLRHGDQQTHTEDFTPTSLHGHRNKTPPDRPQRSAPETPKAHALRGEAWGHKRSAARVIWPGWMDGWISSYPLYSLCSEQSEVLALQSWRHALTTTGLLQACSYPILAFRVQKQNKNTQIKKKLNKNKENMNNSCTSKTRK